MIDFDSLGQRMSKIDSAFRRAQKKLMEFTRFSVNTVVFDSAGGAGREY